MPEALAVIMPTYANTLLSVHLQKDSLMDRASFFTRYVKPSGYPFFEWNGRIYQVDQNAHYVDAGLKATVLGDATGTVSKEQVLAHVDALEDWDAVNELSEEIRTRAYNRLGRDFTNPMYDI